MPTISFYLPDDLLKEIKKEAKEKKSSVSKVIQDAVRAYFYKKETRAAKERLLQLLRKTPFSLQLLEEIEKEREKADEDRS